MRWVSADHVTHRGVSTVLVVLALLIPVVPAASADGLTCGTVITQDTTLMADLTCDPELGRWDTRSALTIGAPGITVDLNGHTIDRGTSLVGWGVENLGHDNVTIRNGTIRRFAVAVWFEEVEGSYLSGLTLNASALHQPIGGGNGIQLTDSHQNHYRVEHDHRGQCLRHLLDRLTQRGQEQLPD